MPFSAAPMPCSRTPNQILRLAYSPGWKLSSPLVGISFDDARSADLASSNEMPTKGELSFQPGEYANRNIWFGVREHGMGAALNGMSVHGGVRGYRSEERRVGEAGVTGGRCE